MRSSQTLEKLFQVSKGSGFAARGERILGALNPARGTGVYAGWGSDKIKQTMHYLDWTYVAINAIAMHAAQLFPNMAHVTTHKPGERHKGFASPNQFLDLTKMPLWGQAAPLTRTRALIPGGNSYFRKALSIAKPHEELEPLDVDHRLRRLFENPNGMDTFFDLMYELFMFMELCGIGYIWVVPDGYGLPAEMWVIPSSWVWPRTGGSEYVDPTNPYADQMIRYYEIRPWGGMGSAGLVRIPPNEILSFPWKSPLTKIDGWSRLTAGARWIDCEESISKSRWAQFINQARPELLIKMGEAYQDQSDDAMQRIAAKLQEKYQSEFNYGKPMVAPPGTEVDVLSFTPTEMAYFQSEDQVAEMILSLFGVPKAAVGRVDSMTFGSILATLGQMGQFCVNPRLNMVGQRFTKQLTPKFAQYSRDKGPIKLWYDDSCPVDPEQINADIAADFAAGAITPNEIRALRGRPIYENGGDDPLVSGPGGLVPLPLATGNDLTDLAELVPIFGKETIRENVGPNGEIIPPEDTNREEPKPESPKIEEPNGEPTKAMLEMVHKMAEELGLEVRPKEVALPPAIAARKTGKALLSKLPKPSRNGHVKV